MDAMGIVGRVRFLAANVHVRGMAWLQKGRSALVAKAGNSAGQGTTEYAILVGVLVVIAIIAITLFRPKIQELWDAIATGINGL